MADHLVAPMPLEDCRNLAAFAGEWAGQETVYRCTEGAEAISGVNARIDLTGFYRRIH